ncbi:MAG: SMC-Scp complex subunit ScpB [bacterium]
MKTEQETKNLSLEDIDLDSTGELRAVIEAALFVAEDSLTASELAEILPVDGNRVLEIIRDLKEEYDEEKRGVQLVKLSGGFKMTTREKHYQVLKKLFGRRTLQRITDSALETLVIIAYYQPVTRAEVESVRGVNSQSVIKTLLEKGFVKISGRRDEIGRPMEYKTTDKFLDYFGLNTLNDLPDEDEVEDIIPEFE